MARRHTVDTYFRVSNRLAKCKPLSVRKEFCLAYLKWLYTAETKDRDQFVELAKKLRKVEMKVGQPRTLLESRARKFFWKVAKKKKLAPSREGSKKNCEKNIAEKTGIHSPDRNRSEIGRMARKKQDEKNLSPNTKDWLLISPTGEILKIRNLWRWCKEHPEMGLDSRLLSKSSLYPNIHDKGWRARKYSPDMDSFDEA